MPLFRVFVPLVCIVAPLPKPESLLERVVLPGTQRSDRGDSEGTQGYSRVLEDTHEYSRVLRAAGSAAVSEVDHSKSESLLERNVKRRKSQTVPSARWAYFGDKLVSAPIRVPLRAREYRLEYPCELAGYSNRYP